MHFHILVYQLIRNRVVCKPGYRIDWNAVSKLEN